MTQSRQAVDVADAVKLVKHLELLTGRLWFVPLTVWIAVCLQPYGFGKLLAHRVISAAEVCAQCVFGYSYEMSSCSNMPYGVMYVYQVQIHRCIVLFTLLHLPGRYW